MKLLEFSKTAKELFQSLQSSDKAIVTLTAIGEITRNAIFSYFSY